MSFLRFIFIRIYEFFTKPKQEQLKQEQLKQEQLKQEQLK